METQTLKLTDIRTDGGTQSRAEIDLNTVHDYAEKMLDGKQFTAVTVFYDGKDYWLADGFHRVHAALEAKLTEISSEVHQGSQRDAILHSVGVNEDHGLKRSKADRERAVKRLLNDDEWGKWSNNEIAEKCNVSREYVRKLRPPSLATVASDIRTYTTKHGTTATMKTGNIGKSSAPIVYGKREDDGFVEETDLPANPRPPVSPFKSVTKLDTPLNNRDNDRRMPVMSTPDSKSDPLVTTGYKEPGPAANTTVSMVEEIARLRKEVETLTTEKQAADDLITVLRTENTTLKGQLEAARKLEIKPVMATLAKQWDTPLDEVNALISSMTERKVPLTDATTRVSAALEFYLKVGFQPPAEYKRIDLLGTLIASIEPEKKVKKPTIPAAQMTEMKNAIAAAFNWEHSTISQSTWGEIQKTAKELIELKVDPTTLCYGHRYCKGKFDSFRPAALVKWYAEWVKLVPKKPVDVPEDQKDIPMPDWAREAYNKVMASFNS